MNSSETRTAVTVRCAFCATLVKVDLARAADRPKCAKCEKPILLDRPLKVEEPDFDQTVLQAPVPVLVDFYADWCAPCKIVAPVVDQLAREHLGKMLVAKVDTDHAQQLSMRYQIRGIPTLIMFRDGKESGRSVGFEPERLRALVAEAS